IALAGDYEEDHAPLACRRWPCGPHTSRVAAKSPGCNPANPSHCRASRQSQGAFWSSLALRILEKSWTKTDRKSTRLNSSHVAISYDVFCLKKKIMDVYLTVTDLAR